jgi:hypothetical protein
MMSSPRMTLLFLLPHDVDEPDINLLAPSAGSLLGTQHSMPLRRRFSGKEWHWILTDRLIALGAVEDLCSPADLPRPSRGSP